MKRSEFFCNLQPQVGFFYVVRCAVRIKPGVNADFALLCELREYSFVRSKFAAYNARSWPSPGVNVLRLSSVLMSCRKMYFARPGIPVGNFGRPAGGVPVVEALARGLAPCSS
jgi:hypothetical protein